MNKNNIILFSADWFRWSVKISTFPHEDRGKAGKKNNWTLSGWERRIINRTCRQDKSACGFQWARKSGIAGESPWSCFTFLSDDFLLCLRPALVTITTVSFVHIFCFAARLNNSELGSLFLMRNDNGFESRLLLIYFYYVLWQRLIFIFSINNRPCS